MPYVEKHAPGAFCWIELGTTDPLAAKAFYTSLFDWTYVDSPMGLRLLHDIRSRRAQSLCLLCPAARSASPYIPPHWNLYVRVASADATTKRALECEGKVFCGPIDVANHGRMSTLADPTGALLYLGAQRPPRNRRRKTARQFRWADLSTPDPLRAAQFYKDLFGWSMRAGQENYLHIANAGSTDYIGGIPPASMRQPHEPPHWLIYFQVDDCDAATAKAQRLGANAFTGPMTIETVGRLTVLADPQGAVFSLFQPEPH